MDTNGIIWTSEDIRLVEKFIEIRNKGYYVSGEELTSAYNRILNKRVNVTQCGSCLRQRVNELEESLNRYKRSLEASKEEEVNNMPQEEIKEPVGKKKKK